MGYPQLAPSTVANELGLDHDLGMTTSPREPFRPILNTDADVTHMWATIINPLGWHVRRFYLMFVGVDDRPHPHIVEIDGVPQAFGREGAERIVSLLTHVVGADGHGSVALMFVRPGPAPLTDDDRDVCRHLHAAARAQGITLRLLHVGTDTEIVPVPMDELLPRSA